MLKQGLPVIQAVDTKLIGHYRHMNCSSQPNAMFAGHIDKRTIIADQPILVIDGDYVLSSFGRIHEAVRYIKRAESDTAIVLRHNGVSWDEVLDPSELKPELAV